MFTGSQSHDTQAFTGGEYGKALTTKRYIAVYFVTLL